MISSERLEQVEREYKQRGYAVVDGLFTVAECCAIQNLGERLPSFTSGDLLPVMNPHLLQPEFVNIMSDRRLLAVIRRLMRGDPVGLQTQYFFGRPGTRGFSSHQDNYYVRAPDDTFVSAWLALEDATVENGALVALLGSHREPVLEIREIDQPSTLGQDPNHNRQECIVNKVYPRVDVVVRQGGVVFLHSHLVHSSNDNTTSDRFRRVLLMTYLAEGSPFRPGFIANRSTFRLSP
jgi:phytanoyl-CoA hydroxylase